MPLTKIMVIIDPTQTDQPAFERALESAHLTGARLHLYACLGNEQYNGNRGEAERQLNQQLGSWIERASSEGSETTAELEWADDWRKQAVNAAARCSASMIFKTWVEHSDVEREIRTTYDWTLLRLAPCPVLLIKNFRDWKHRRVLAAVNSLSTDEAHLKLNNQIISFAQQFSDAYGSDAHIVTAFTDRNHAPEVESIAAATGVARDYVHVVEGKAAEAISRTAEELEADLILIGTVGRSGLKGTVVGNTSEKLLDHTTADILVLN